MENELHKKSHIYAEKLRRQHKKAIMAQMRSKVIASRSKDTTVQLKASSQLNSMMISCGPNNENLLEEKIVDLLEIIVEEYKAYQQTGIHEKTTILEQVLTQQPTHFITVNLQHNIAFRNADFTHTIKQLPAIILQISQAIKFKAVSAQRMITQKHPTLIFKNIQDLKILVEDLLHLQRISLFCQFALEKYKELQTLGQLNQSLVYEVTNCLIEISCLKFEKAANSSKISDECQLMTEMEALLQQIKECLHKRIFSVVIPMVFGLQISCDFSLKIFVNLIYICGNIFVSLSEFCEQTQYVEISGKMLKKLEDVIQYIFSLQISSSHDFFELCELAIWFIRNELLMIIHFRGKFHNKDGDKIGAKATVMAWLKLVLVIFKAIEQRNQCKQSTNKWEYQMLCLQMLSILQIILNDFKIQAAMFSYISYVIDSLSEAEKQMSEDSNVVRSELVTIMSTSLSLGFITKSTIQLGLLISSRVLCCSNGFNLLKQLFKFKSNIHTNTTNSNVVVDEQLKSRIHYQIYINVRKQLLNFLLVKDIYEFDRQTFIKSNAILQYRNQLTSFLNELLFFEDCNQTKFNIKHSAREMQAEENACIFQEGLLGWHPKVEEDDTLMLDAEKMEALLQMVEMIWMEEDAANINQSLNLLVTIANMDCYESLLKATLLQAGFQATLENLSMNPNSTINETVYALFELLHIQS